jgi:hypothetical protein
VQKAFAMRITVRNHHRNYQVISVKSRMAEASSNRSLRKQHIILRKKPLIL